MDRAYSGRSASEYPNAPGKTARFSSCAHLLRPTRPRSGKAARRAEILTGEEYPTFTFRHPTSDSAL